MIPTQTPTQTKSHIQDVQKKESVDKDITDEESIDVGHILKQGIDFFQDDDGDDDKSYLKSICLTPRRVHAQPRIQN